MIVDVKILCLRIDLPIALRTKAIEHQVLGPVAIPVLNLIQFNLNLALSTYLVK